MANTTIPSELIQADVALGGSPTTTTQSASDNTTKIATTAYVTAAVNALIDSAPGTMNTLNEIAAALNDDAAFNTTVTNAIATKLPLAGGTMTGNITLGDNNKAIFGAGSDLQIYHNGSNASIISDNNSASDLLIQSNNIVLENNSGHNMIHMASGGAVQLYHNNVSKVKTTATGAQIGLNNSTITRLQLYGATNAEHQIKFGNDGTNGEKDGAIRYFGEAHGTTANRRAMTFSTAQTERMRIDSSGDVLIGQTSQTGYGFAQKLVVGDGDNNDGITIQSGSTHQGNLAFNHSDGTTAHGRISYQHGTNYMQFFTNNTERMRIDSAGTIYQGTTTPTLHSASRGIVFENGSIINDVTRGAGKSITLAQNAAVDSGNTWAYLATDEASYYQQFNGNHYFGTAPSGSAGADVTFNTKMMIHNSGCIDLGANTDRSLGTNITTTVTSGSAGSGFWMSTGNSSATSSKIISSTDGSVGDLLINQGSGVNGGAIRFSINDSEKMRIPSNGKVGINKIDGTGMLNIQSNSDYTRLIELFGSGNQINTPSLRLGISGNNSQVPMIGGVSAGYAGLSFHYYYLTPQIQQSDNNGDLRLGSSSYRFHTVYSVNGVSTSDERVKEEIENLDVGLDFIKSLKPKKFKYKDKDSNGNYKDGKLDQKNGVKKWGLIAQEVKKALDDNSITEDIGLWSVEEGECNGEVIENQQQIQYQELISPLIKAIQELEARIATLEG